MYQIAAESRGALAINILLAMVMGIATLSPHGHMPSAPGSDKLHHFLAFGTLVFLMVVACPRANICVVFGCRCMAR